MNEEGLFKQDWQDCLRAHYAYVVREQDMNNERSLVTVLLQTGFTEHDIDEMRAALGWVAEPALPQPEPAPEPEPAPVSVAGPQPAAQVPAAVETQANVAPAEPEPPAAPEIAAPVATEKIAEPSAALPILEAKKPAKPASKKAQDDPPEPPKQMSLF